MQSLVPCDGAGWHAWGIHLGSGMPLLPLGQGSIPVQQVGGDPPWPLQCEASLGHWLSLESHTTPTAC